MKARSSFGLIRDGNFRIFFIGQTVSWLGGVMQSVAQGWLVWSLTHSVSQLVLTAIMVSLPLLLFSIPAGVLADRVDRRALLIATQALSLIPACLLGILTAGGAVTPTLVLYLAFLQGTVNAFDVPARHSFLSELVPRGMLCRAIAVNAVCFNAARMVGPVVAGCIMAAYGPAPCFFINALSFPVAIATLLMVRRQEGRGDEPENERPLLPADLREGVFFVRHHEEVRWVLLMVALVSLLGIPFVPLLPVFADALLVGVQGLGTMSAFAGGGSLLAALSLSLAGEVREQKRGAECAALLFAAALLVFSRSGSFHLSLFALFLAGAALVLLLALASSVLQRSSPDRMRGRVMGVYTAALLGTAPLGHALMGGLAATSLGAAGALSLSASLCLAVIAAKGGGWQSFKARRAKGAWDADLPEKA